MRNHTDAGGHKSTRITALGLLAGALCGAKTSGMTNTLPEIYGSVPAISSSPATSRVEQFRRDNAYLLPSFLLSTLAFVAVVTATSVSVSLLAIGVGLPLLALSLMMARGFASVERVRLRALGMRIPQPATPVRRSGWHGWIDAACDRRSWLDAMHAVVTYPIAAVAGALTVTWWAAALGGLSYPLWRWTLPDGPDNQNLAELMGITSTAGDIALNLGIGAAFAITLVPVVRGLAGTLSGLSRAVLAPELAGTRTAQ